MKKRYDLSTLDWELSGCAPHMWEFMNVIKQPGTAAYETQPVKARVPGSVQAALRDAGVIPDWNVGDNARLCEWVENRHWVYKARIPDGWIDGSLGWSLDCQGLDYSGWVYVNGRPAGTFKGTHVAHRFDLTGFLREKDNVLEIIFDVPPRWLGQYGYTSKMTEWKTRFNYTWDWAPRMVQTGIWDAISLVATDGDCLGLLRCTTDFGPDSGLGALWMKAEVCGSNAKNVRCELLYDGAVVAERSFGADEFTAGVTWSDLAVRPWWPNLMGGQPLYTVACSLADAEGRALDSASRRVGFRRVEWLPCRGAPAGADPWICAVNGRPVFLQGFNFQPIRCNYADLTEADYRKRLDIYKDIGANCFRINACGYLEFECFYDLCDEMGFMVWQEFPLTSSGIENWPPEDPEAIESLAEIARSFITRRQHHPSLIAWGGSNEQQGSPDGGKAGMGKPCPADHPALAAMGAVVAREDPTRRYIPTSPLGPVTSSEEANYGKGLHWDVHGPSMVYENDGAMRRYWAGDDALFRAEIYCCGAAPADSIRRYAGDWQPMPASPDNPMWRRPTTWWNDWEELTRIHGRAPATLEEYVQWSQAKQAERQAFGMKACRDRFPAMGGTLMWGSHDTTPMPVNTTVIDFDGNPKPAAWALKKVWRPET